MNQKITCAIIKDLMPNYIDHLTSNETNETIEEHLDTCESCKKIYEEMKEEITTTDFLKEATDLSKFLRKTKAVAAIKAIILGLLILGMIICIIVDLAITHIMSWSIIVTASCVMAITTFALFVWGGRHRFLKASACCSILTIPLLYVISIFCKSQGMEYSWFYLIAIPVALIWLAVFWIGILLYTLCGCNMWKSLAIVMVLAIPGNLLTNALASGISPLKQIENLDTIINTIAYFGTAIVLFVVARIRKGKKI